MCNRVLLHQDTNESANEKKHSIEGILSKLKRKLGFGFLRFGILVHNKIIFCLNPHQGNVGLKIKKKIISVWMAKTATSNV